MATTPSAQLDPTKDTSRWKDSTFLLRQLAQARKFVEDCEGYVNFELQARGRD